MTILDFATTASSTASNTAIAAGTAAATAGTVLARGLTAVQLHDSLWRVTRADGEVAGYVERFTEHRGTRFRAKRLVVRQQRFVAVGEFWSMDDALQCFRMN